MVLFTTQSGRNRVTFNKPLYKLGDNTKCCHRAVQASQEVWKLMEIVFISFLCTVSRFYYLAPFVFYVFLFGYFRFFVIL